MKGLAKVFIYFFLGIFIMGGFYYYLDRIYFAPTSEFTVTGSNGSKVVGDQFEFVSDKTGKLYYSHEKKYMAVVKKDSVKIYTAGKPKEVININLNGKEVSYFEWLNDRDLAIMGLYGGADHDIVLEQFNPESPDHKVDTKIDGLPRNSKIVDVVYSTATNVVYMKVEVDDNAYRIYRTDANYDTRRIYVQATNIGRIDAFKDEDRFFYDNLRTGTIYMYEDHKGSWRIISPDGRYLLIGVDKNQDIYIAKVDKDNKALSVSKGKLGVGFETVYTFDTPQDMNTLTVASIKKMIEEHPNAGKDKKDDKKDSKKE